METIDCKCGTCSTVFPLQIKTYKNRYQSGHAYVSNEICCPSCQTKMPINIQEALYHYLSSFEENGWTLGTHFLIK